MGLVKNGGLKISLLLIAVCVLLFTGSIFAQGDYIENCQGGAQIVGGLQINDDADGFTGGISGSFKGIIDLGLAIGYMDIHKNSTKATTFSPSIFVHAIKPSYFKTPVSVSLGFVYQDQTTKPNEDNGNEFFTPPIVKADYYIPQIIFLSHQCVVKAFFVDRTVCAPPLPRRRLPQEQFHEPSLFRGTHAPQWRWPYHIPPL